MERKKQGFNVIQVMITGVYPEWDIMKGVTHENATDAWLQQNPLAPNEEYFKRTDSIISMAREYGIILVIGVYHAIDVEKKRISMQNARSWAAWLSHRYKLYDNVVWSMYPHADSASFPIIRETIEGLKEGDSGTHLLTAHPIHPQNLQALLNRIGFLSTPYKHGTAVSSTMKWLKLTTISRR